METTSNPKVGAKHASRLRLLALAALVLFLASCSSSVEQKLPELAPTADVGISRWNSRLVATIENPDYDRYNQWMDPIRLAQSGDLHDYGRVLNHAMTSYSNAYRVTRDMTYIRQLKRIMDLMRGQLKDYNGDGFVNWRYLNKNADSSSSPFYGTDKHKMEEMLTHSVVAASAYTLKQAGYSSDASYWTNYLKNIFEKKWRKRTGRSTGFPFLTKNLTHTYVQWIRYHYYMYKLTGDSSYYTEAKRMAGVVKNHMVSVSSPNGAAYVWQHGIDMKNNWNCQPTGYILLTIYGLQDLAITNSGLFDSSFMRKVSNAVSSFVLKNSDGSKLAGDICGGTSRGGLKPSSSATYGIWSFVSFPYSALGAWDTSGKMRAATERAYAATERYHLESPRIYNLPAMMLNILSN